VVGGGASGVIAATWDAINLVLALLPSIRGGILLLLLRRRDGRREPHPLEGFGARIRVVSLAAVVFLVRIHR
jgi:hypothetical protein